MLHTLFYDEIFTVVAKLKALARHIWGVASTACRVDGVNNISSNQFAWILHLLQIFSRMLQLCFVAVEMFRQLQVFTHSPSAQGFWEEILLYDRLCWDEVYSKFWLAVRSPLQSLLSDPWSLARTQIQKHQRSSIKSWSLSITTRGLINPALSNYFPVWWFARFWTFVKISREAGVVIIQQTLQRMIWC